MVMRTMLLASVMVGAARAAEPIQLKGFETDFSGTALGGILKALRFEVSRPDRMEIALRLFSAPTSAGGLPIEVGVIGPGGETPSLGDIEGADCTERRTSLFKAAGNVIAVEAARAFDPTSLDRGLDEPAPLEVRVFRLRKGIDAGDPPLVLELIGKPARVGPGCKPEAFDAAIRQAAGRAFGKPG